jgi:hypothetical protein
MLGGNVQGNREAWSLTRDTRNMNDSLRVAGAHFAFVRSCDWVQPAGDRQLCRSDGMDQVDVQASIMADSVGAMRVIFGLCSSGWVPEVCPVRFEDASSGANLLTLFFSMLIENVACHVLEDG